MYKFLCLFLFFSSHAYSQVNLTLGLRAYYPFNGNAADVSGNNNHAVFNNATSTFDRFGNANSAYRFDGVDDYMMVLNSASLNMTNQISIVAWVKVSGFYQGTCHDNNILMKGDNDQTSGNYFLRFSDNIYTNHTQCGIPLPDEAHQTFIGHMTVNPVANPNPYVQKDRWYSLVYTYDGVTAKMYVNCELAIQGPANLNFTNGYNLFIGKMNHPQYPYWFNGTADEIRIYDRVINIDEIKALGDCLAGNADLTSSQFFTTTQLSPGSYVDEVIAVRNVGNAFTNAPVSFTITNYSALTGLTVTPITAGNSVTVGIDQYTITPGWTFNAANGTFTSSNVIAPGSRNYFGIRIARGVNPNQGANGTATQTTTISAGTGGGETPTTNNSISNTILKN